MPDLSRSVSCLATPQDAIRCGTVAGAYAAFEEELKDFIQPRHNSRDLVVLAQDPSKADPSKLRKTQAKRTMVGRI